jgi:hypothetical protein
MKKRDTLISLTMQRVYHILKTRFTTETQRSQRNQAVKIDSQVPSRISFYLCDLCVFVVKFPPPYVRTDGHPRDQRR